MARIETIGIDHVRRKFSRMALGAMKKSDRKTSGAEGGDMERKLNLMVLGLRGFPDVQGGVETHAQHLYSSLASLGCNVEVVVRSGYQREEHRQEWNRIRFRPIWAPKSTGIEAMVHTFLGVLYAALRRPDILHIHAVGPAIFTPLARLLGLRVVITHHGPDYEREKWGKAARQLLRLGERMGVRFANQRIVISNHIEQLIQQKYRCASTVIPNGVVLPPILHSSETPRSLGLEHGRYTLLVSRMVPEKRHTDLIRAFRQARLPGWKLAIAGGLDEHDAYTRSVIELAKSSPDIVLTGFQSGTALQELYSHAGMFVLPSSHEGLPIALLEALSFGLPAIASNIPANLELGIDSVRYFQLGDIDGLAQALQIEAAACSSGALRTSQRSLVSKKYNWDDIAHQTFSVYREILRTGNPI